MDPVTSEIQRHKSTETECNVQVEECAILQIV